jgi:iron complex outermembrane receptor protein
VGNFGRNDQVVEAGVGNESTTPRSPAPTPTPRTTGRLRAARCTRPTTAGASGVGLTPDQDTRLELTFAKSDGQAAYADRSMDGVFDRSNVGLKFEKSRISPLSPSWRRRSTATTWTT